MADRLRLKPMTTAERSAIRSTLHQNRGGGPGPGGWRALAVAKIARHAADCLSGDPAVAAEGLAYFASDDYRQWLAWLDKPAGWLPHFIERIDGGGEPQGADDMGYRYLTIRPAQTGRMGAVVVECADELALDQLWLQFHKQHDESLEVFRGDETAELADPARRHMSARFRHNRALIAAREADTADLATADLSARVLQIVDWLAAEGWEMTEAGRDGTYALRQVAG